MKHLYNYCINESCPAFKGHEICKGIALDGAFGLRYGANIKPSDIDEKALEKYFRTNKRYFSDQVMHMFELGNAIKDKDKSHVLEVFNIGRNKGYFEPYLTSGDKTILGMVEVIAYMMKIAYNLHKRIGVNFSDYEITNLI